MRELEFAYIGGRLVDIEIVDVEWIKECPRRRRRRDASVLFFRRERGEGIANMLCSAKHKEIRKAPMLILTFNPLVIFALD